MYEINYDYIEILAGTSNHTSRAYTEASANVEKNTESSMTYLTNFLVSIEKIAGKVEDKRISGSKGNIKNFSGYENIKTVINFLNKNLSGIDTVRDCVDVFNALENFQPLYTEGYQKNCRFTILEYENALYLLVTALSMVMSTNMEVVTSGTEIRIQKKSASTFGVIPKTIKELAKQMKDRNHRSYLEEMLKAADSTKVVTESALSTAKDAVDLVSSLFTNLGKLGKAGSKLFKTIKSSFFGIIPLIRTVIYMRYKKKADTIAALEQQAAFILDNIEQLKNIKTMDPKKKAEIIKKQQAVAIAYTKKAEKLRAELCETEKEASTEIKNQNVDISKAEDDFVLEHFSETNDGEYFEEKASTRKAKKVKRSDTSIKTVRLNQLRDSVDSKVNSLASSANGNATDGNDISQSEFTSKVKKAISECQNENAKDSILLKVTKSSTNDPAANRTKSKFGGVPYWPKNMKYPTPKKRSTVFTSKGETDENFMYLLAQINFAEMPKLGGYPTSGILQIFLAPDDLFCYENKGFQVVYHKDVLGVDEMMDVPTEYTTIGMDQDVLRQGTPFIKAGVSYVKGSLTKTYPSPAHAAFFDTLSPYLAEEFGKDWDKTFTDSQKKALNGCIYGSNLSESLYGSRIGGYHYFTQNDPLIKNVGGKYVYSDSYKLLMQLDSYGSDGSFSWGDSGVASFFITPDSLSSKSFAESSMKYYWDCY